MSIDRNATSLKRSRHHRPCILAAAAIAAIAGAAHAEPAPNDLIPRSLLFASPTYSEVQISPDGKQLAFLHPLNGVLNIWVAPLGDPKAAVAITRFTSRPPDAFQWSPDGRFLIISKDVGGEEHSQVWIADPVKRTLVNLTDDPAVQTKIIKTSKKHPNQMLVGLNKRDQRYHDVFLVDLATGKRTEIFRNDANYINFIADPDLKVRIGVRGNADGSWTYFRLGSGQPSELMTVPLAALRSSRVLSLDGTGKLLMFDSRNSDKAALSSVDLPTGAVTQLAAADQADIVETIFDETTGALLATREDPLVSRWTGRTPAAVEELAALAKALRGPFKLAGQTPDNRRWLVLETAPGHAERYLWWDRAARTTTPLFSTRPELETRSVARRLPVMITARDGLTLPSYLTLPAGIALKPDGMPVKPLPMVLVVHGGPWLRDDLNYDPQHQWLADRGYAALSVNFRGSGGFGKAFTAAADRQWSGAMHNDLIDAVNWAAAKGVTEPDKMAVMGLSYGGYSTLVSLSFTPDVFRCGVDLAGPSNLPRLIGNVPAWWTWQKPQFINRVGNPHDPAGAADLMRRSPIARVADIKRPLLVTVGANDPRVPPIQTEEIVDALNRLGKPVTYAFYPDEGHVYAKDRTNISFAAIAEHFFAQCLGGPVEPFGRDLAGSGVSIKSGADLIPGLPQALRDTGAAVGAGAK